MSKARTYLGLHFDGLQKTSYEASLGHYYGINEWPYPQILDRPQRLSRKGHSSLFLRFIIDKEKKFYNIEPRSSWITRRSHTEPPSPSKSYVRAILKTTTAWIFSFNWVFHSLLSLQSRLTKSPAACPMNLTHFQSIRNWFILTKKKHYYTLMKSWLLKDN